LVQILTEAENGFWTCLISSLGDEKYYVIDVCIFFRLSAISEAIPDEKGIPLQTQKS